MKRSILIAVVASVTGAAVMGLLYDMKGAVTTFWLLLPVSLAVLLLAGWIGLTVCGSLLHLLRLMARVRRLERPTGDAGGDPLALAGAGLVVVAIALDAGGADAAGKVMLAAGYTALLARVALLAVAAVRVAPLRIWRDET